MRTRVTAVALCLTLSLALGLVLLRVPPAAAQGDPWIGDIAFGYDRSEAGAVPAGGKLPDVSDGSIDGFFSWRNVPPGSSIGIRILWGGQVRDEGEFTPNQPEGRLWVGMMQFASSEGGDRFDFADVGIVVLLNGQEMARGSVALP